MISAEVICDSISPAGKRLTTFKLRYPKFIHGEFMTHRTISRNASSSRAIPTAKLLEEVRSDLLRAAPVSWGKNQKGMQAAEELSAVRDGLDITLETLSQCDAHDEAFIDTSPLERAQQTWSNAARSAAYHAEHLERIGAHKQIVNRILEPFSHINVIATATEWMNFFGLRLHKDAQPEMRALAEAMWKAYEESYCYNIPLNRWHLPFVDVAPDEDEIIFRRQRLGLDHPDSIDDTGWILDAIKVSVARCARVSYESFETGKRSTIEEDLKLYERLTAGLNDPSQPLHASPMEHQATPDVWEKEYESDDGYHEGRWKFLTQHKNFVGWRQYRAMLPNESCAPLPPGYDNPKESSVS